MPVLEVERFQFRQHLAQVPFQIDRCARRQAHEDQTSALGQRKLDQTSGCTVDLAKLVTSRDPNQRASIIKRPAMIGAGKPITLPLALFGEKRAPMPAGTNESTH